MMMNDYVALIEAHQHQSEVVEFARKERLVQIAKQALLERFSAKRADKAEDAEKALSHK
jgi:hypothetical protein